MYVLWCPIMNEYISDQWRRDIDGDVCSRTEHLEAAKYFGTKDAALKFVKECATMDCPEASKERHPDDEEEFIHRVWLVECVAQKRIQTVWVPQPKVTREEIMRQVIDGTADWF